MIRIQNNIVTCLVVVTLLAATSAYAAETAADIKQRIGSGNPVAGKTRSELCQGCHGEVGLSLEDLIPNLAGQYAPYIAKQLRNFQSGARTHQIMSAMATTINDAELIDIAAYFASQKKMQGNGKGDNPVAKNLFLKGDASRSIQACVTCHGENGKGMAPNVSTYPVIGGQHKDYLRAQLIHWRSGERSNSPDGVMNKIAKSLTDSEIEDLTDYLAGL
ncbi:MAG: c-type cytochrome [Nitrosomonadales bacterium]|nr:c-type cytochrome [Nitrosomonadales bacterium]